MKIRIANLITGTRILCSAALLLCPVFSLSFFFLYLAAGLTDMIDGLVARKTGTVTEFGAKLDTAADFVLVAVCLWKLLPSLAKWRDLPTLPDTLSQMALCSGRYRLFTAYKQHAPPVNGKPDRRAQNREGLSQKAAP